MTLLLYGGATEVARRRELRRLVEEQPAFDKLPLSSLGHSDLYEAALVQAKHFIQLMRQNRIEGTQMPVGGIKSAEQMFCYRAVETKLPIEVHYAMFIPALAAQTSPEQREKWLPLALDFRILGAYAQTELGHGSNVRGLETTATYLTDSQEFEIHSPSLTSTKWWPGGLGLTATHAIVYARLLLRGSDFGVHGFLVQLRSLEDHSQLEGVTLGDIGPKVGFNSIDNGFARFNRVRIPREQMLMRFAKVTAEGTYVPPTAAAGKLGYLTMVHTRAGLVAGAGAQLARAVTIAVRYSLVRQQGGEVGSEPVVLDYSTQQDVLLPLLAATFALHFAGARKLSEYNRLVAEVEAGDMHRLPHVHAQLAALKAYATYLVADGIEACRRSCGGHGFLWSSGLPLLLNDYTANCTLEGTRDVLEQQAARYFLKHTSASSANPPHHTLVPESLNDLSALEAAFKHRAQAVTAATQALIQAQPTPKSPAGIPNLALVEAARVSRAHCEYTLVGSFRLAVEALPPTPLREALATLCRLFALRTMQAQLGDFLQMRILSPEGAGALRAQARELLSQVRPHAAALVEGWDFSDHALNNSTIGSRDGRVYERLMESAEQHEALNHTNTRERFEKTIKSILRGRL